MRAKWGLLAVVALVVAGLAAHELLEAERRPRPPGWKDEWAALPLENEAAWSMQPLKRSAVQATFFGATPELSHCVEKYHPTEGQFVTLELFTETVAEGTHFEFVDATAFPEGAADFAACVTGALEGGALVPTPAVPAGTKWRLSLGFLVPPLTDLPRSPWWRRFLPDEWRPPGSGGTHVG